MNYIENRTFDEIKVGDTATLTRTLTEHDITLFAVMSGDINPAHVDPEYAKSGRFRDVIGHGMWSGALISTVLGTEFPGPGTIYLGQNLRFRRPVMVGDTVTINVEAMEMDPSKGKVTLKTECVNQDGEVVVTGTADVIAPKEKVRRPKIDLPDVRFDNKEGRFREVMARVEARHLGAVSAAIVCPNDVRTLSGAMAAAEEGIVVPVLVGQEKLIRAAAADAGISLEGVRMVFTGDDRSAITVSLKLARDGEVEGIMKGNGQPENLLVPLISAAAGLRTDRRVSHVHVLDVPTYSKPLFVTDSMVNIAPSLQDKRDICQNAIDLAHALGIPAPKVAILAGVENINPKMQATIDAATLCKMAERAQITGGILDGPLRFDHAVSLTAAEIRGITSAVAGQADILLVPDLESGNMIARQLIQLTDAVSAGIVLGARVPVTLTGRSDDRRAWLASASLLLLVAHLNRSKPAVTALG